MRSVRIHVNLDQEADRDVIEHLQAFKSKSLKSATAAAYADHAARAGFSLAEIVARHATLKSPVRATLILVREDTWPALFNAYNTLPRELKSVVMPWLIGEGYRMAAASLSRSTEPARERSSSGRTEHQGAAPTPRELANTASPAPAPAAAATIKQSKPPKPPGGSVLLLADNF